MIVFFFGEIHGRITEFYDKVLNTEKELGLKVDWVLQIGNFGIYPDPSLASYAAKKRGDMKEFANMYLNGQAVPRNTLFISGPHEDHRHMNLKASRGEMELVPNLSWLVNGYSTMLEDNEDKLKVLGLGKVYSPAAYAGGPVKGKKVNKRLSRYTRAEVERACSQGPVDLILAYQAPTGHTFGGKVSEAHGLSTICFATRPSLYVHGCYGVTKSYTISQTRTPALALAPMSIVPYEYHNKRFLEIV